MFEPFVSEAGHHDVRVLQELIQKRGSFRAFQVHTQELLVRRTEVEGRVVDIGLLHAESAGVVAVIIAFEWFDLVDRGSHFRQNARAGGSCDVAGKLYYLESF